VNINDGTARTVSAYPLAVDVRTKYVTDEEDYTSNESIAFSIHTNQQRSRSITLLAGFAYENINYAFSIEVCLGLASMKTPFLSESIFRMVE
jgi:hypothetical protein